MVLLMAKIANASGLTIGVDGVANPANVTLVPSNTAIISVISDGTEMADVPAFLVMSGPGTASFNLDAVTNNININKPPGTSVFFWTEDYPYGAVFMDIAVAVPEIPLLPPGVMVDNIVLRCDSIGDVTLSLYLDRTPIGGVFQLMDTQVIHQIIPEPITVALLGLGALFLRRRK